MQIELNKSCSYTFLLLSNPGTGIHVLLILCDKKSQITDNTAHAVTGAGEPRVRTIKRLGIIILFVVVAAF